MNKTKQKKIKPIEFLEVTMIKDNATQAMWLLNSLLQLRNATNELINAHNARVEEKKYGGLF